MLPNPESVAKPDLKPTKVLYCMSKSNKAIVFLPKPNLYPMQLLYFSRRSSIATSPFSLR